MDLLQFVSETSNRSNYLFGAVLDFYNHGAGLIGQRKALLGLLAAAEHLPHGLLSKRLILLPTYSKICG